jgi:hypothetical protein
MFAHLLGYILKDTRNMHSIIQELITAKGNELFFLPIFHPPDVMYSCNVKIHHTHNQIMQMYADTPD